MSAQRRRHLMVSPETRKTPRLAGLAAALLAVLGLVAAPASAVGELSPTGEQSFSDIASCSSTADTLLVTIVVDESQSLELTDPDNKRVDAILTALDSLEELHTSSDLSVEANLAVFGSRYTELVGWGVVEGEHAQTLSDTAGRELPGRNQANLTDYRAALNEARASLDQRATAIEGATCKLALWLTDGKLDVDGRGDRPATDAARVDLCQPGGIVDGLRADGVALVALGLLTSGGPGSVTQQDRDRLQAIAEGSGGAETCGTVPVSGSVTNGAFLNAEDAGALNRIFAQTVALIAGASNGRSVICPGEECINGRLTLPVDPGVGSIRLVLEVQPGAPAPQLVDPSGEAVVLETASGSSTVTTGAPSVSVLAANGLVTIDVRELAASTGTWTLVTDVSTTTVVDLYYFWGITLTLEAPAGVVIGETSKVDVRAQDAAGKPVDLGLLGSAVLEATINGETAAFELEDGVWTTEVSVPSDGAVSSLQVQGRATATTSPSGIQLGPVAIDQSLVTEFPPSFPSVTPAQLDLGRLTQDPTAQATLTIKGAERGPTQACFGAGEISAPERAGTPTLTASADCLEVPTNESVDVVVTFTAAEMADGRVEGHLPVSLTGVDGDGPIEVDIPVTGTMVRPVDEGTRLGLVAALVLGALALAALTAWIARWLLERFELSTFARSAQIPVRVSSAGLERTDRSTRFGDLLTPDEVSGSCQRGKRTSLRIGPADYRVRYPAFPLAEAQAYATGSGGQVVISDLAATLRDPARRAVRLPGTSGFVIVTERPTEQTPVGAIDGVLVLVLDPGRSGSPADLLPERLTELRGVRWGDEVERARKSWGALDAARAEREQAKRPKSGKGSRGGGSAGSSNGSSRESDGDVPPLRGGTGGPPDRRGTDGPPERRGLDGPPERRGGDLPPSRRGSDLPPRRGSGGGGYPGPADPNSPPSRPSPSSGSDDFPPPRR